ncbi:MAG: fibrobacter succinogenes major paralogous domain-containing protein [Bacteroidales bacterium]|nr:fibrobacter succinogenes major paralogous domain-containing protein [Bacteroidales bacterium]
MAVVMVLSLKLFAQPGIITLSFTGDNNGQQVVPDSVWVKNLTQSCDTTLYSPNLILVLDTLTTGIINPGSSGNDFYVSQNFPNPFIDKTTITVYLPERDNIEIRVSNLLGQQLIHYRGQLNAGINTFQFFPSNERFYHMAVKYKGQNRFIRMLATGNGISKACRLKYQGSEGLETFKSVQFKNYFDYNPGDQLLFVGHTSLEESGLMDSPIESKEYIFQFATNIPCPGLDSLCYDGKYYHTIQIFSQCWMKENMNAGIMIPSSQAQTNNNIIEKYCMGDNEAYCNILGGLYFWDEMMKYTNENGGQGICPEGWHIPGDLDWQILEGAVDSQLGIGDPVWGMNNWRGTNAGGNLKKSGTGLWEYPNTGATDSYGFTLLPGGYFVQNTFWGLGYKTYLWSSQPIQKFYRNMDWNQAKIQRNTGGGSAAFSVRCIMN